MQEFMKRKLKLPLNYAVPAYRQAGKGVIPNRFALGTGAIPHVRDSIEVHLPVTKKINSKSLLKSL
jgi:hypothetical protein